jgi:sugar phosphate isomerase/epimerase/signal transduction histidine kinase
MITKPAATPLRFGLHTIIWGPAPKDLPGILRFIREAGFQGVELFQHPEQLGSSLELKRLLQQEGLELIGLCSGTLEQRVAYCDASGLQPHYLYVDEWDVFIPSALDAGYTVAVHPHVYKQAHIKDAFSELLLQRDPRLKLILDPAHLVVGGLSPLEAIGLDYERLIAVHLKNWVPWYGRSFHRYAQGFQDLGTGKVPLVEFLSVLRQRGFSGWAIIEQDSKTTTPEQSVMDSVRWLLASVVPPPPLTARPAHDGALRISELPTDNLRAKPVIVADAILKAQETPQIFPEVVVRELYDWIDCGLVSLWAHCPLQRALSLVSCYPPQPPISFLKVDESLCGETIHSKRPVSIPDLAARPGRSAQLQDLIDKLGLKRLLSVPILNRFNPNDVELVLNVFPRQEIRPETRLTLVALAEYIALAAERILSDRCTQATGAIQELFVRTNGRQEFLDACLAVILRSLDAEAASIFLTSQNIERLEVAATTGIKWYAPKHEQFYEKGVGSTGQVWGDNVEHIALPHVAGEAKHGRSEEICPAPSRSLLFVPVRDYAGKAIGVVRCRSKVSKRFPKGASFSQEDATVLQAVCDAMVPRLLLFDAEERTFQMFQRVTHELKMPLVGVNSQLDFIEAESADKGVKFSEDWIGEARDSTRLMGALVENAEVMLQQLDSQFPPEKWSRLWMLSDVVAPIVDQMAAFLKRFGLSRRAITYSDFKSIPKLSVKANSIRQVMFNLISNAIKYRHKDRSGFAIHIDDEATPTHFLIHVRDWGPGVDRSEAEMIFEWGRRGLAAHRYDVSGNGFGLALSRQIMREHGGDLVLSQVSLPTVFTLQLPRKLEFAPLRPHAH